MGPTTSWSKDRRDRQCTYRLVRAFPRAGGRPVGHGSGSHLGRPTGSLDRAGPRACENPCARTVSALVSSPRPSTFTRPRLATRPRARSVSGRDLGARVEAPRASSRFTTWYSMRNGFLNPFAFGRAAVQRRLATFEAGRHGAARALALGAAAGGLAALAADAATDAALRPAANPARASGRGPSLRSPPRDTRCGTRASMPRISGRSGRTFVEPIRPSPSARKVPRCFGFVPIVDRTSVTFS